MNDSNYSPMMDLVILPIATPPTSAIMARGIAEWLAWKLRERGTKVATPLLLRSLAAGSLETGSKDFINPIKRPTIEEAAGMIRNNFPAKMAFSAELTRPNGEKLVLDAIDPGGIVLHSWLFKMGEKAFHRELSDIVDYALSSFFRPESKKPFSSNEFFDISPTGFSAILNMMEAILRIRNGIFLGDPAGIAEMAITSLKLDINFFDMQRVVIELGKVMLFHTSAILQGKGRDILSNCAKILNHPAPLLLISSAYQSKGDENMALDAAKAAQALDPSSIEAIDKIASLLQAQGKSEEAVKALISAIGHSNDDGWLMNKAGALLALDDNFIDAEDFFKASLKRGHKDAHSNLGRLYLNMGRLNDALLALERGLLENPSRSQLTVLKDLIIYGGIGQELLKKQAQKGAENGLATAFYAQVLVYEQKKDRALEYAGIIIKDQGPDPEAYEIGRLLFCCDGDGSLIEKVMDGVSEYKESGLYPDPDIPWQKMNERMPDYWLPLFLGSLFNFRENEPDKAFYLGEKALSDSPDNPLLIRALGEISLLMEEWNKGEDYFRQALKITGLNPNGLALLAQALIGQEKYDEAARIVAIGLSKWDDNRLFGLARRIDKIMGDDSWRSLN